MYNERKLEIRITIIAIIIAVAVILSIYGMLVLIEHVEDSRAYGDGVCKTCGGNYIYQYVVGYYLGTKYIYACDRCGHIIELNYWQK